jgi:putative oxidoreductase
MKALSVLGRFIYAIPMGVMGVFHFMNPHATAMELKGWPIAEGLVYITGLALILAAVSIIINVKARLACLLLAAMLLIFILSLYVPGVMKGNQMAMINLLKDSSLLGAALTYGTILNK